MNEAFLKAMGIDTKQISEMLEAMIRFVDSTNKKLAALDEKVDYLISLQGAKNE